MSFPELCKTQKGKLLKVSSSVVNNNKWIESCLSFKKFVNTWWVIKQPPHAHRHPQPHIMSKSLCLSASFNGKADGLKRCELINNSSAHVFILIYSSLRVIIRIIKAKRACICVPPLPLGTPPMRTTCTHIRTHTHVHSGAPLPLPYKVLREREEGILEEGGKRGFLSFESSFGIIGSCFVTQL